MEAPDASSPESTSIPQVMTGPAPTGPPVATPPTGPSAPGGAAQEGLRAQARVKLGQAVRLLTEAIGVLKEVGSEEGKAILKALQALAPITPEVSGGVSQSEIAALMAGMAPVRPASASPPGPLGGLVGAPRPNVMAGPPMPGPMGGGAPAPMPGR